MSQIVGDRNLFAQELFTTLPQRYDSLAEVLSMGQNGRWRRAMVDRIVPATPGRVLDVASGTAGVALQLAARTPADIVGVDLTLGMLARGRRNVAQAGMHGRVQLVAGRAEQLPFPDEAFDALTFTYSLEFFVPPNRFWRMAWWLYTRLALPAGGRITGGREWFRVGRFLGPNISGHYRRYPLAWTVKAWEQAGFEEVGVRVMSLGGGLVMWGTRSGG